MDLYFSESIDAHASKLKESRRQEREKERERKALRAAAAARRAGEKGGAGGAGSGIGTGGGGGGDDAGKVSSTSLTPAAQLKLAIPAREVSPPSSPFHSSTLLYCTLLAYVSLSLSLSLSLSFSLSLSLTHTRVHTHTLTRAGGLINRLPLLRSHPRRRVGRGARGVVVVGGVGAAVGSACGRS